MTARCVALVGTVDAVLGGVEVSAAVRSLAAHEQAAARAFKDPCQRLSYVAAHLLVRRAAALFTGSDPRGLVLVQRCAACGGAHGKPGIEGHPGLHVSLSRRQQAVAAVAATVPAAIDIEAPGHVVYRELRPAAVFTDRELAVLDALPACERDAAALRRWVKKECLVKLGHASLDRLSACDPVDRPPADVRFTEWVHPASGCVGAVAAAVNADLRFLAAPVRPAPLAPCCL